MNKQEIIEAINSTIMPNGQKGITAEALANILIEMANASGGGGAGAVVYVGTRDESTDTLSQTDEQKLHNAEVFQLVKRSEGPVSVFIDASDQYEQSFGVTVRAHALAAKVSYFPQESASLVGLPTEAIVFAVFDVGEILLLPDGTLEIMPAE